MSELREKLEESWWKLDAKGPHGQEMMPTPKEHLNLLGGKQKYLDATIEAVKAHIKECERPKTPWELGPHRSDAFEYGVDKDRKKMLESLE